LNEPSPTFDSLGLAKPFLRAIADAGYTEPTPIQRDAIPPALQGRDIVGIAQTGTGKTAAFSLPLLQRINDSVTEEAEIRALVVTPTRELAAQIGENIGIYAKHLDEIWHTVIFGGVNEKPQIRELQQGVDILVATPGRLLDLHSRRHINLKNVSVFVLDEADRMLDMGFLPDVKRIIAALPNKKQTMLFSATMPPAIRALGETLLHDPVSVSVTPVSAPAERIDQRVYFVDKSNKRKLLASLIQSHEMLRALVFSRTKHGANRIAQFLEKSGIASAAIHGNKSQGARTRALAQFKAGRLQALVATDIAARGIDVEGVTHVINFDLPNIAETYVHRIGRTARAGASGIAMSFCDVEEQPYLADIERLIRKHLDRATDNPLPSNASPPPMTDLDSKSPPRKRPQRRSGQGRGGQGRGGQGRGGQGRGGQGRGGQGRGGQSRSGQSRSGRGRRSGGRSGNRRPRG